jgi:hypothetical protein
MAEINKILDTMTEVKENYWGELKERKMFYLMDIKDGNAIVVNNNWDTYYGIPYTVNGDIVTLTVDSKVEYVPDWRPKQAGDNSLFTSVKDIIDSEVTSVKENYENKVTEVTDKFNNLETEKSNLEVQLKDITEKYSTVEPELTRLKEFESTTLAEERNIIETELFSQYEEKLGEVEEFKTLKENSKNFSISDLEKELALMFVKNTQNFSLNKKQNSTIKIKVEHKEEKYRPYGDLIKE